MRDDYLWDGSGEPDPEVERLERLLSRYRQRAPAPDWSQVGREAPRRPTRRRFGAGLAIAATLALVVAPAWFVLRFGAATWEVAAIDGTPRVGSRSIAETGRLVAGQWLETDARSRARISVGQIGQVEVRPSTRLRMIEGKLTDQRLALARGEIQAKIWAPPRIFAVETPFARAVDLGCIYTLQVDETGAGLLRVESGWVAFEVDRRESFVPAGAMSVTRPGLGPGTPYFEDAPAVFRAAVDAFDTVARDSAERLEALDTVLASARKRDAFTLWHLIPRTHGAELERVFERMAALAPPPPAVTREAVLRGDRAMLDAWWNTLGLDDASWWRIWKGPVPSR
jgi:hypothetical protein